MDITRDSVNDWLVANRRDRDWLAEKCGVGTAAVGHWLNKKGEARPIPAEHQITIRRLMDEDAAKEQAKPLQNLVLEFDDAEYSPIERAALKEGKTVREWSKDILNGAATLNVEAFIREFLPNAIPFPESKVAEGELGERYGSRLVDEPATMMEVLGGIAAGSPIITDPTGTKIAVSKTYPADHYALQVFGKSMEPKIPNRSYIVVRKWKDGFPKRGTIVVYTDAYGATLKVYDTRKATAADDVEPGTRIHVLRSLNPDYPDVDILDGGKIDAVFVEVL
jgi:SOS-response transcriptional repressor LexA